MKNSSMNVIVFFLFIPLSLGLFKVDHFQNIYSTVFGEFLDYIFENAYM